MIEAGTGAHLWADRFDGSLDDIFDLQDKVAISIAGVIEPTLQAAEIRYSAERPTKDLTAYDLYLRARANFSGYKREHLAQALALLEQAIEHEPRYGPALDLAATYRVDLENYDWADSRDEEKAAAQRLVSPATPSAPPPMTRVSLVAPQWCSGGSARISMPPSP